jgi:hypothetical protein
MHNAKLNIKRALVNVKHYQYFKKRYTNKKNYHLQPTFINKKCHLQLKNVICNF